MDSDFEGFDRPYLCYDWRRTGRVGTAEFVRSTIRCGFPFTRAQVDGNGILALSWLFLLFPQLLLFLFWLFLSVVVGSMVILAVADASCDLMTYLWRNCIRLATSHRPLLIGIDHRRSLPQSSPLTQLRAPVFACSRCVEAHKRVYWPSRVHTIAFVASSTKNDG